MKILGLLVLYVILSVNTIVAQSGWQWINPLPQGNHLSSVLFTDANTGYTLGDNGTILKTSDGGNTWTLLPISLTVNLKSIFFTDQNTAYVAGDQGIILKTNDAGNNWNLLNSGTNLALNSVFFTDANHGYAVGLGKLNTVCILKTNDGGNTWSKSDCQVGAQLFSVYFITEDVGFTIGSKGCILKTTDGGASWTQQLSGTTYGLKSVFFTSPDIGYITSENPGILLKTTDGGQHWNTQNCGITSMINSIYFTDNQTAWAVCDNGIIIKTTNSGSNWTVQNSGTLSKLNSVFFLDSNTGWVVGDNGIILKTNDGGTTWLMISQNSNISGYSMVFTEPNTGYIANTFSIYKTNDGGLNWTISHTGSYIWRIYFLNTDIGFAVGPGGVFMKTIDAGNNWTYTGNIYAGAHIIAVHFTSPDTGFILIYPAQNSGLTNTEIRKTTDGGSTFTIVKSEPSSTVQYLDIVFPTKSVGYVTCSNGKILKSIDEGQNWTTLSSGTNFEVYSPSFTDESNGYILKYENQESKVLHTNDGGGTWIEQTLLSGSNYLTEICFVNASTGFAIGKGGNIFSTHDAGNTWTKQISPTNKNLNSISFVNPDIGYILGDVVLLKTTTGGVGISEINDKDVNLDLKIYPNPNTGSFTIDFENPSHKQINISLYDLSGKLILKSQTTQSHCAFNEINLHPGIYIIKLSGDQFFQVGKIIINK